MKRILLWLSIALAVVVLAVVAVSFLIDANTFKPTLEANLTSALNREVKLGSIQLSLFSGGVTADDLSIADNPGFSRSPFLKAKSLRVEVELIPLLFSRKLNVTGLTIDQPEIALLQSPSGDWNFSSLGTKAAPASASNAPPASDNRGIDLLVKRLQITAGRLTLGRTSGHRKPLVLQQVKLEVQNFSSTSVFPFSFSTNIDGGGSVKLDGKAGPLNATDASMTPVSAALNIAGLDLAGSGLNEMAPAITGLISFDGSGNSSAGAIQVKGKITAEKLKLAQNGKPAGVPVALDFAANHNMRKHSGVLNQAEVHIGKASAKLTGTYFEEGDALMVKMDLSAPDMPLTDLAKLLPALDVVLPAGSSLEKGTLTAKMSMEGPANKLVTAGTVAISNAKLAGFDLGKKMAVIAKLAGIQASQGTDIQNASANVHMAPDGISVQDFNLMVPAIGQLQGGGTISPSNALAFKMRATVKTAALAALANTSIPFSIEGTAADPVFRPDIGALAKENIQNIPALQGDRGKALGNILDNLLKKKK